MNKLISLTVLALSSQFVTAANLDSNYRTSGKQVHQAFRELQPFLQSGSAVFNRGRKEIIFGTVVSAEGHILTKASELGEVGDLVVTIDQTRYESPVLVATDPAWDVALVKVDAEGLKPVDLAERPALERGEWLVANGAVTRRERRVQVGVVAASAREVKAAGGAVLGVELDGEAEGLVVGDVSEGGGASKAGLKKGDVIRSLNGEETKDRESMLKSLEDLRVGQKVTLGITRDGEEMEVEVELAGRTDLYGEEKTRNDGMSGEYSARRTGFPAVFQHDIMANRHFMGGPVFDLEGRCVGMNIARFSRCESYAIPAAELREIIGRLVPAGEGS